MVGFSLVMFGVLFVGYTAYRNFTRLVESVQVLSEPNNKVLFLNHILHDISEAEISLRQYILIPKTITIQSYVDHSKSVIAGIDSIKEMASQNPNQLVKLDTLTTLLQEKLASGYDFLKIYSKKGGVNYYSKALAEISIKKISANVTNNEPRDDNTKELNDALGKIDSINRATPQKVKKGFLKSKKKKREDSIRVARKLQVARAEVEKVVQDLKNSDEEDVVAQTVVSDTVVKSVLSKIQAESNRSQKLLTQQELKLIKKNGVVLDQFKSLVNEIVADEEVERAAKIKNANDTANRAIWIIVLTGIIGTFSSVLFGLLILNDLKRRNNYRNLLISARETAENNAKNQEEFLANMSHEIRTPLNAILGFSEQLDKTSLDDNQSDYLKAVKGSSTHLLATVNDILDFSKIQASKLTIEKIPFYLDNLLEEVHATLRLKAAEKNIELKYSVDKNLNHALAGDPFRIKQVLINLVNNAIKFTDKGYVAIEAKLLNDFKNETVLDIEVNDTGIGVSEDKLETIFKGFSQSDSSTTRKYGGTGLGLTISKRLTELMGGKLNVRSTKNIGSTFTLTLSLKKAKDRVVKNKEDVAEIDLKVFSNKRFLVIDDDPLNLKLIKLIFDRWLVSADYLTNSKVSTKYIDENTYDLILTDIQMPDFSGLDIAEYVQSHSNLVKSKTPVVAFTANVMKDDLDRYLKLGISDYLLKPFKEIHLYNKLIKALKIDKKKITITEKIKSKISEINAPKEKLFSLEEIKKFTDNNDEVLLEILNSFVKSTETSLKELKVAGAMNNRESIKGIAHKMLPLHQHLKMELVLPQLKKLEPMDATLSQEEIAGLLQLLLENSNRNIEAIKSEIKILKKRMAIHEVG